MIGADRVAVLGAFDRLQKVQPQVITPQTLVISDGKDGASPSGTVMTTYLATLLSTQGAKPGEPYGRSQKPMYESSLAKDTEADSSAQQPKTDSPMTPSSPPPPASGGKKGDKKPS